MADNLDPETLRQLNESMREMRETVAGMVPAMVLMTAAMNENMNATKGNANTTKNGKKLVDDFLKSQQEATAATESRAKSDAEKAKVDANYTKAKEQGLDSLKKFCNGLLTAGGGMTKYSSTVGAAGDAAVSMTKSFGLLGWGVGKLIKLFTVGAEMVLKQNEAMLNSADILADFGATGALTTKQLLNMANAAGYSSGEMEKFAGITKGLGTDIIGLSATVTGGVKAFAELATMDETLLANYRAMGVTQEQLNKNQADYIKLQIKSGLAISDRDKRDGTLKRTTIEYTNYLMDLSAITGLTVDEAKKAQEVARADLAVQTRLALLQDKEEKLRSRGLAEGNKEMIAQADSIQGERKRTEALVDFAGMFMKGEELAGVQSMIATGNFNELSASFASGAPEILDFINAVKKGAPGVEAADFGLVMAQATKRTRENLGETIIQNKEVGKAFAFSIEAQKNEAAYRLRSPAEEKAARIKEREERLKGIKEGTNDPAKAARNAQEQAERRARLAADAIVGLLSGPVTSAFEKLLKVMSEVMKGIAVYSDKLFGTNLAKLFETPEEIKQNITNISKDIGNLQSQLKEETELRKKYLNETEKYNKKDKELQEAKLAYAELRKKGVGGEEAIAAKKKIEQLESERSTLSTEKYKLGRELESRGSLSVSKDGKTATQIKLEKQLAELEEKRNKRLSDLTNKELELGKITPKQVAERNREASASSAKSAESAGTQSDAESRRLGMTQLESDKKPKNAAGAQNILDFVAKYESGGDYNKMYGGKSNPELSNMSIAEVLEFQQKNGPRLGSSAIGKYQFMQSTINGLIAKGVISPTDKFDASTQEKMGMALLEGRGYSKYKSGNMSAEDFANSIAAEWAGMPMPTGQSRYAGDGKNKALVSRQEFIAQLEPAAAGGIFSGANTGYPVALHGNELVAPLNPNSVIAKMLLSTPEQMMQSLNNTTVAGNGSSENNGLTLEVFTMLAEKLDTMITILSTSNDTQEQLLKYSRV
jgi:hypothetical protein